MRPKDYKDLSAFWHKHGFHETNMTAHRTYREVNETKETKKLMRFWLKEL
jgi:virulence-associated protein VapD